VGALTYSLVASYFLKVKRVEIDYLVKPSKKLTPILASSILNGLGSATYAVSYTLQPVITPLIVEMYIPAVIVLGSLFLREKLYNTELIGSTIILTSIFAYILL
jgi:drug/metabolite transporter (DMT)-like permease